ncbi:Glycosyltransferase involved in cell wall bisynthesis [Halomonas shengliensis]|uniref:Glycosyltransferase involved in cell wall bisynthesis n=1 Tax=Halomonas shengliensis TaxID=419597 RepID=A0A1H0L522_9GAMM|nr:glycosyltransferase family 4 protein [Halomonas shengliensis]SDO63103.1 Glycosyltransferase involved in cell wall bisynthesis [Halomonas shengliensis]
MHIVIMTHGGGSPYHGPNMRWYFLGKALRDLDFRITIVSSSYFHKYHELPNTDGDVTHENIDGIKYVWLKTRSYQRRLGQVFNQFQFAFKAYRYATSDLVPADVDVVVASSPHPFVIYAANRLAHQRKVPLLYEVRDLWPLVIRGLSGAPAYHPYLLLLKFTEWFAVRKADVIASVKPGDKDYFQQMYDFDVQRFFYAPNGFYVDKVPEVSLLPEEGCGSGDLSTPESPFVVGYVGALSSYYGINDLIEAARLLQDDRQIRFRIVGGGEDLNKLRDMAKQYELTNIEFVGPVPKSDVLRELQSFNACYVGLKDVEANRYGISCNKLFEYMHAGKPVIASYKTDYDPVAFARCGITVPSGNPSMIANAVMRLKENPSLCHKLGKAGANYFYDNHEFSVVANKYYELFHSLKKTIK